MARAEYKTMIHWQNEDDCVLLAKVHLGQTIYQYRLYTCRDDSPLISLDCKRSFGEALEIFIKYCCSVSVDFTIDQIYEGKPQPILEGSCY